ncbi:unnamed protein product [Adineta steineri]|uniref:Hypoxia up-regulated protein 1 n=1 Tax=Adineta steineri TaxID=433720 RepID=A0A818J0W1_9BILA|nr:unnamed protein product [Adineta steineri]
MTAVMLRVDSHAVMSVDLGTEFMKIGVVKPGIPMEIALNKESRRKTPVIVAIKGKDREFGDAAISRSSKIPAQSYMYLRELVGKTLDNPIIEQYLKRFPYYKLKTDAQTHQLVFQHDSETNYTIEELLSMILRKAREYATDFAEQSVDAAVITVPPYFTQSERRAVKRACDLADIKLLQLMNDNTAVALNYGIFRRKYFNSTGSTYLFYDMGSQSTTCTIATYNIIKTKEHGYVEEVPQVTVKAVAFDRNLGGLEFQIRLRDYLAKKFHEKHSKIDLYKNSRALTKLFREAERAKHVLSANNEYTAQVEGLIDEIDFKQRITREEFENLYVDLFERVKKPIEEVLRTSGIKFSEIQQVLLFGGSTRIPRVQNELTKALGGIELGKSLNTDEAAAMGAVYQAAAISKGYRVKKFLVKDTNQYPINVEFERHNDTMDQKLIDRILFDHNNIYPNRKLMTFNKYTDDFSFNIHYGDLTYLSSNDKHALGITELSRIHVTGVNKTYDKHKDTMESKGVRAHFQLDDSCLLVLDRIEFIFGKKGVDIDNNDTKPKEESTLSKIGSKISSFFSSKSSNDEVKETTENTPTDSSETKKTVDNKGTNTTNDTVSSTTTNASSNTTPKPNIIREALEFKVEILDYTDPSSEAQINSKKKLSELDAHDRELIALSTAKNNLETFIYDIRDKLEHDSKYKKASTSHEQTKINEKLTEIDTWLGDEGFNADVKTLKSKLDELKTITKSLKTRVREVDLRPIKLQELKDALNQTEQFLYATRTLFLRKDLEDDKPISEIEIKHLDKMIKDTYLWRDQVLQDFSKLTPTDTPKYLSTDIDEKMNALKRETNYLLTKAQRFVPKPKTTTTTTPKIPINNETKTDNNSSNSDTTPTADYNKDL